MQKGSFSLTIPFRIFYLLFLGFGFLCFSQIAGAQAECPVQLSQQRVVVRYGGSVAVNCSTSVSHKGMGWEASEGAVAMTRDSLITWRVSNLTEWEIKPYCYINHKEQCQVELPVIIYKTPDNVSISIVKHRRTMIAGRQYQLQCDVQNVAPVHNLTVKWYKGQTLLNQTTFTEDSKTPVNVNPSVLIRPDRDDDGAQYRCEAELDLGAEGPQYPPNKTSDFLSITVYSKPIINETKLPSKVPVFREYSEEIVCEAEGNPKPTISWILGTNDIVYNEVLTISESTPEYVSCVANNSVGTTTRNFTVFIQDISISTVNHTEPMTAGKQYDLQCSIKYVAPFKIVDVGWYKWNKNNIIETIKTPDILTYTVQICPDKADNGSQFWCEAKLEAEGTQRTSTMKSANLSITVHFKPIINETKLPSVVPVFRGCSKEIVCEAEGNPKPTISWILGTNDIVYNETLTISESTPEYVSCVAENSVGTTTRKVKVFIQDISISTVNHTEPMIAGKQYDLQCSIKYVAPFKIVDVGWYKWNKNNIIETIKTPDILTYTVQIRPHRADNGSQFWCEAKLEAEGTQRTSTMKSANLSITVHFKPIINETKLPSVVPVFRGYSEEIVCEAEGNPKPTISWILGTNDIVYNKALTISESTPEYVSCVAENSVGTTTRKVKVFIQVKPIINETKLPSVVPVFRGYSKEIVCEAEGNPKPTISWILGTNDIVYNEVLTISESTPENVSCVAENSAGKTTRQVKVFIQENYVPIILGIIAAVVVAISVIIFIYIYFTYYKKKPRTGRYDVKEPKAHKEPLADEVPMNELC
ncbi:hemicentin-1 isoform X11 [Carassius gibelio]|uniref:hemicentin-1 isoform X11 n=1 Tax=Carassius gibelio TaxID=101364 RepID=UPI0022793E3F|nr:hemicentin-1 isoform X11 [Carassius gibelio]